MNSLIRMLAAPIARMTERAWRRLEDRRAGAAGADAPASPVRVMNLNYALVPLAVSLICAGLVALLVIKARDRGEMLRDGWPYLLGLLALSAGALWVGSRRVLWVDLGESAVIFRRLFGADRIQPASVERWGFELSRGRYTHTPPISDSTFLLVACGNRLEVIVSPVKATRIAAAMDRMCVGRRAPTSSAA